MGTCHGAFKTTYHLVFQQHLYWVFVLITLIVLFCLWSSASLLVFISLFLSPTVPSYFVCLSWVFLFGEWKNNRCGKIKSSKGRDARTRYRSLHLVIDKENNHFSLADYFALDGCKVCFWGAFSLEVSAGFSILHAGMTIGHSDCDWTLGEHWSFCLSQWTAAAAVLLLFYSPALSWCSLSAYSHR